MKVVLVNKSDRRGGAAVVSSRLLDALRNAGIDARMLVAEKLGDSPYVDYAAPGWRLQSAFLAERLKIFLSNGFDRKTLFKIDTASDGVDLLAHPWARDADVICLNWVNQGMLSIKGIERLSRAGKRIIWTMHDLWCMTGVCHHTDGCGRYAQSCGECHFLGRCAGRHDISHRTFSKKKALYDEADIHFVAVSSWLAQKGATSALLAQRPVTVIPNVFPVERMMQFGASDAEGSRPLRIVMGAARLDDTVKGLPVLVKATQELARIAPELASRTELVTFGGVKNPESLSGFGIRHRHLGMVKGDEALAEIYRTAAVVVSTSQYETLPGTLVEGQAYGAIPVSFDRGGQRDIIEHLQTGYLVPYPSTGSPVDVDGIAGATEIAHGLEWGLTHNDRQMRERMRRSVMARFSPQAVVSAYLSLF